MRIARLQTNRKVYMEQTTSETVVVKFFIIKTVGLFLQIWRINEAKLGPIQPSQITAHREACGLILPDPSGDRIAAR